MKTKPEFELAKKLPGKSQLDRVRAARAILNGSRGSEALALHAFMDIFHPEFPQDKVREMVSEVRERDRR